MLSKKDDVDVFVVIVHRLQGEDAQEAWDRAGMAGLKISAPDARVTEKDDETGRCTQRDACGE